jgi:polyisoprenoid-binding protein YceI
MMSGEIRVRYVTDVKTSQFTVQAFAAGMISVVAHSPKIAIRDCTGEAVFLRDSLKDASLVVRGKTASFEVVDELRDDDRRQLHRVMCQEALEVDKYPEFVFQSSTVAAEKQKQDLYRANIAGDLRLHGVSHSVALFAQVALGVDSLRAYGESTILQTDYDIKIAPIAGGTLKLQDELKCSFYTVARKKTDQ